MGSEGFGRAGRVVLYLAVLNVAMLAVGLGMQYVDANRMPDFGEFNAAKIRLWSQPDPYQPAAAPQSAVDGPAQASDTAEAGATAGSVSVSAAAPSAAPASAATTAPQNAMPQTQAAPAPAPEKAQPQALCLSVDDLSQARYDAMQALLKSSALDDGKCAYRFDKKLGWWVYWPPEYEAVQRQKVLEALHAAGVKDVFPIIQGALAQAFSVGMFAEQDQAKAYRNKLRSKGLDKIEYGPRPSVGSAHLACSSGSAAQLSQLRASLPAWAKPVDAAECAAPAGN